jgi:hypothetical protein
MSGNPVSAHGMRHLATVDLAGGGQITVEGTWAYVGHMKPPHGTSIIDVADPRNPRVVATLGLQSEASHTHKVRVAGDIMITNVEQNDRHAIRRAQRLPEITQGLHATLGRPPTEAELAHELHVDVGLMPRLRAALAAGPYADGGFKVWDIADRARPRLLSYMRTGGVGVHRFDMDANHAYISTEMAGYVGNILVIYDLKNPANPTEVSRWAMPGQHVAAGEKPTWPGQRHRLHHAMRDGDMLWAAVWYAGIRAIDITDISQPRTVGEYRYHPPFPEPTHTIMRWARPIGGRRIAVGVDEEHEHTPGQPHAGLWVFDVTDPAKIQPLAMWHLSELASPFVRSGARFGAHQFQERSIDTHLFTAWFGGGLRVVDIANPEAPTEVAHYLPAPPAGFKAPQSNDVDVDARGLVYLLDRNRGLEILERT